MVVRKLNEPEITEQKSLRLTRNLLRIAISKISYVRGLFPENYFNDKSVPALGMKIKKLMPIDAEPRRLIDWMEKGVYHALRKKYLQTLLFCISEAIHGPMIEEYAFSFSYSDSDIKEVMMNISRTGNKKEGATFEFTGNIDITPNQMTYNSDNSRSSACKMIQTLVQLMQALDPMPEEPVDYEPPFFRGCSEQEASCPWLKNPLKMEIENVHSKHFVLALKVKSILDPRQDENNDMEDYGKDSYSIWKQKEQCEEIVVKDVQVNQVDEKLQQGNYEDYLYMKEALYHVLPLAYVTIFELQSKLEGEANEAMVRKLLYKMTCDGYVEAESNPGLGSRVIRSEFTSWKLLEVTNALGIKLSTMEISEPQSISTCGGLCYVCSNLTGTREISVNTHLNGLSRTSEQPGNNTPFRRTETAVSRESGIPWNNNHNGVDGRDETSSSRTSHGKLSRKTSTVEEPILQNMKFCNNWHGLVAIGYGSTGLGFINPETIIMCTDGKVTGERCIHYYVPGKFLYKRRMRYIPGYWRGRWVHYEESNSVKLFVLGNHPYQILASCAGMTYWYEKIIRDLRRRLQEGQNLIPEMCSPQFYLKSWGCLNIQILQLGKWGKQSF